MTALMESPNAWAVRRIRAEMLKTLPDLPLALCKKSRDPDMWHPERPTRRQEEEAKAVCHRCPERVECLSFALRAHAVAGIWGATTEAERGMLLHSVELRVSLQ